MPFYPRRYDPRAPDVPGTVYGRLTLLDRAPTWNWYIMWRCRCACGQETVVPRERVLSGRTISCGCYAREVTGNRQRTHGRTHTPEYKVWEEMRARCHRKTSRAYHQYGAKGIHVCPRWRASFEAFLEDMGERPGPKYSIDRHPNPEGDYTPENCRWATQGEQRRNQSRVHLIEWQGRSQVLMDWTRELRLPFTTIWNRLLDGWSVARAFTTPVAYRKPRRHRPSPASPRR